MSSSDWPFRLTAQGSADAGCRELETLLAGIPPRITVEDQLVDNGVRASFAAVALIPYAKRVGTYEQESVSTVMSDLLNDLRHLCDLVGLDWEQASEPGHYDYEVMHED
ncbi:hypothetical protein GOEFS_109_00030 [Gordonia effusa NBRC 100432]|uniref:Uncharacterized protein n=1 Tax=Gordonia effusa NBRC 100432 TaxID=1077974 RepID=H0R5A7_9ACTN|nr:hypothetical protein [Gordonia effusa]GAB20258.1 hypothetical protein GOEFS_109_00030 [Gordonia effusa NBRC 100432]